VATTFEHVWRGGRFPAQGAADRPVAAPAAPDDISAAVELPKVGWAATTGKVVDRACGGRRGHRVRRAEGGAEASRAGASARGASAAVLDSGRRRGRRGCRLMPRGAAASTG